MASEPRGTGRRRGSRVHAAIKTRPCRQIYGLVAEARAAVARPPIPRPSLPRRYRNLPARTRRENVDRGRAGERGTCVARARSIYKFTVTDHLNRAGVMRRLRGMSDDMEINWAVRLYASGLSLARIGERLGFSARTIQSRLRERGVCFRDAHGRERCCPLARYIHIDLSRATTARLRPDAQQAIANLVTSRWR